MDTRHDGISRRTLARGAAWSVPVIATAFAAPAAVASGQGTVTITGGCHALSDDTGTAPSFTIAVAGTRVGAGSTFALTLSQNIGLALDIALPGSWGARRGDDAGDTVLTTPDLPDGWSGAITVRDVSGWFSTTVMTVATGTILDDGGQATSIGDAASVSFSSVQQDQVSVRKCE